MYLFGHHHDEHSLWKLVCVALACVVVVFGLLFMFSGCASGSALDLSAVKLAPAGDIQAVKTGDIAPIKAPIKLDAKIEATGQAGMTNTVTRVSANGDLSQVTSSYNDSTVMKKYITLMQYIIYSLAGIIAILIGFIGTAISVLIGGVLWIVKYVLQGDRLSDSVRDSLLRRKEKQEAV